MGVICQIHVEKPAEGFFRPGSHVVGTIKYTVTEDKVYDKIVLSLKGTGYCQFTNNVRNHHNKMNNQHYQTPRHFTGNDVYVNLQSDVLTDPSGIVVAGEYTAPFSFVLPFNIPPTFNHTTMSYVARIQYYIKLKFSKPGVFTKANKFKREINVGSVVIPKLSAGPMAYELHKSLTSLIGGRKNDIKLQVTLNQSVTLPGSCLQLLFAIENNTNINIPKIKTGILRTEILRSDCNRVQVFEKILKVCKSETPSIDKGASANLSSVIEIPNDVYTVEHSRIISRDYKLIVTVKIPGFHRNAELIIPLTLGEIMTTTAPVYPVYVPTPVADEPPSYWEVMEEEKTK